MDTEMPTVDSVKAMLSLNERGTVAQTIENAVTILKYDPVLRDKIKRNELSGKTDIVAPVIWKRDNISITDTDVYQIQRYLENTYGIRSERAINKAINIVASENTYHPIKDKLESLVWDGTERIKHLLPKFLGSEESEYTEAVMKLLMLGAISRVYNPGCKFEIMVCLVGGQGAGKSTFFRFLAMEDDWFSDDLKSLTMRIFIANCRIIGLLKCRKCRQQSMQEASRISNHLSVGQRILIKFHMKHTQRTDRDSVYL